MTTSASPNTTSGPTSAPVTASVPAEADPVSVLVALSAVNAPVPPVFELPALAVVAALASALSSAATLRPAVTSSDVAGAAPSTSMFRCPVGPSTYRMNWESFVALSAGSPVVGTTR